MKSGFVIAGTSSAAYRVIFSNISLEMIIPSAQFQLFSLPLSAQWTRAATANNEMTVACYQNSVVNTASADFIRTTTGTDYVFAQRLPTVGWSTLDYGNSIYLSRTSIASLVATSTDGINWNTYSNSTAGIQNGTFGLSATFTTTGGAFTFVPAFWTGNLRFSQTQNGIDFTISSVGSWTGSYTVGGIGYGNKRYVVPKANSTDVMIISAGFGSASIQAESKSLPSVSNWSQVAYGNGIFLVISDDSTAGAISSDNGNTWSSVTLPAFNDSSYFSTRVIFGGGRFFAVGGFNSAIAAFSTDGQRWFTKNLPVTGGWAAPAYYNRKYVTFLKNSNVGAYIDFSTTLLYGTGQNLVGQLGLGNFTNTNNLSSVVGVWSDVNCGTTHTMGLSAGTYKWYGTGSNADGELGIGSSDLKKNFFIQVPGEYSSLKCGGNHTMALSAGTNKWYGTGYNFFGQLGLGNNTSKNSFTPLTGEWSQMVCGNSYTMALSAGTNKWYGTGFNFYGQLGLGDTNNRNSFTPLTGEWSQMVCGNSHTMAMSAGTNKWYGTGFNFYGQLGLGNNTLAISAFTPLTGEWSQMVCGGNHTMALSAGTNKWYGTGLNDNGQLGLGNNTDRNIFTPLTGEWSQMVCGNSYTMAMSAGTNKWYGTGINTSGQLGLGDTNNRNSFTPLTGEWIKMVCGGNHTMAISGNG